MYPENLKYTNSHQWVSTEGIVITVGITNYAQEQLGEVVYIDLPQVGDEVTAGEVMGSVESVKSISDLYSPVTGKIIEVNEPLMDEPGTINSDPYGAAWMVKIEMANPSELEGLLNVVDYQATLE